MKTLSSRTNLPRGVVVYAVNGRDVASFPAFLSKGVMPTLNSVIKLCRSVIVPHDVRISTLKAMRADAMAAGDFTRADYIGECLDAARDEQTQGVL